MKAKNSMNSKVVRKPWSELTPEEKKVRMKEMRDSIGQEDPEKKARQRAEYEKEMKEYHEQSFVRRVELLFLEKSEKAVLKMKNRIKNYLMEHQRQNPKLWDDVDWSKF